MDKVNDYITNGKVSMAISTLLKEDRYNIQLRLIKARFFRNEKNYHSGIITYDEYNSRLNRITRHLLNLNEKQNSNSHRTTWVLIALLVPIVIYFLGSYNTSLKHSSQYEFKILVLPFNPYKSCRIEKNSYENVVFDRINTIIEDYRLDINIEFYEPENCILSEKNIKEVGLSEDAHVVLWGKYIEECSDSIAEVNYRATTTSFGYYSQVRTDDEFISLSGFDDILDGIGLEKLIYNVFKAFSTYKIHQVLHRSDYDKVFDDYFEFDSISVDYFSHNKDYSLLCYIDDHLDLEFLLTETIIDKLDKGVFEDFMFRYLQKEYRVDSIEIPLNVQNTSLLQLKNLSHISSLHVDEPKYFHRLDSNCGVAPILLRSFDYLFDTYSSSYYMITLEGENEVEIINDSKTIYSKIVKLCH